MRECWNRSKVITPFNFPLEICSLQTLSAALWRCLTRASWKGVAPNSQVHCGTALCEPARGSNKLTHDGSLSAGFLISSFILKNAQTVTGHLEDPCIRSLSQIVCYTQWVPPFAQNQPCQWKAGVQVPTLRVTQASFQVRWPLMPYLSII